MKNKTFYTAIAYWCLALALVLLVSGCKTKKSTTDLKVSETENVSIVDNSETKKKEVEKENTISLSSTEWSDKSFFEAWMSFESDKITITDNQGNKTEITNPRINKKSSKSNDVSKTDATVSQKERTTTSEENTQNDIV